MPVLKLANLKLEDPKKHYQMTFERLLKKLGDTKYNWQTKVYTRSLIPISADLPQEQGIQYQQNYIGYLTRCWGCHYSVVIEPNHVWYTLLCELALKVKADPEIYRSIFTTSQDKKVLMVPYNGGIYTMNMDALMTELRREVPTDTQSFFPEFTTNTYRSVTARYAAFADMASPYYDYMMLMCGFPAIDVQGTRDDWRLMADKWQTLAGLFPPLAAWFTRVQGILDNCVEGYNNPEWWKGIYTNEKCGSGSQVIVSGWFSDLFYEKCDLPKPENFPSCVSTVNYTSVNLHAEEDVHQWSMKQGLFFSYERDGFLVPDFGYILFNVADEPYQFAPEMREQQYSSPDWIARLEPENAVQSKKMFDKARKAVSDAHANTPEKLGPYQNAK